MIPLSDDNPTLHTPIMTWLLLGGIFAVWMVVQGGGMPGSELELIKSVCNLGMVPAELTHRLPVGAGIPIAEGIGCLIDREPVNTFTPVISMFLHGSWGHILGNALFFWVFGNNIEDSMGPGRFLVFYLICGLVAAGAHIALNPASPVPTVGASGAISGILGAYLVLYPGVHVNMLFPPFIFRTFAIRAWIVLIYWFGVQVLTAKVSPAAGGVAVWAHIGGFVAGVALVKLFENPRLVAKRNAIRAQRELYSTIGG